MPADARRWLVGTLLEQRRKEYMQGSLRLQPTFVQERHLQPHIGCNTSGARSDACALQPRLTSKGAQCRLLVAVTPPTAHIDPGHERTSDTCSAQPLLCRQAGRKAAVRRLQGGHSRQTHHGST